MGQLKGDGKMIFMILIGVVMFLALMVSIANQNVAITTTGETINETVTMPAAENGTLDLTGRTLIAVQAIVNATNASVQDVANATLQNGISATTGLQTVQLLANGSGIFLGEDVNVSYTYEPDGYLPSSGSRSSITTMLILLAVGIVIFVIAQVFGKESSASKLVKKR